MSKLTLSMIVKNEERYLRDCLESVKDVVDEIVIVDTGSNDNTVKIAEEYGAFVFHFKWVNDFSAARNFALSKSNLDWILYLDADERLSRNSVKNLIHLTKADKQIGYNCIINNLDDFKDSPKLMKYVRLFRNSKDIRFTGKAHEQIEPSLINNNYKIVDSNIEIIHYGYNVNEDELKIKAKRNLELLLDENLTKPTSYLAFQIANSYSILEETKNTINYFREALKDKNLRREFKSVCYLHISDYEMRLNNLLEAKRIVDKGLQLDRKHVVLNMIASQVYEKLEKKEQAISYCKKALECNKKSRVKNISSNVIDIFVSNTKLLTEGILLSLKFNQQKDLQFFLNMFKKENPEYYNNISKVLFNASFNKSEINGLIEFISDKNLEVFLKLLKYNNNNEFKLEFFSITYERFKRVPQYLTNFGTFLLSINQLSEARRIFESELELNDYDDAIIFYLVSIYTSLNNLDAISSLIAEAESKAEFNPILQSKLSILKQKLEPILSFS